MGWLQRRRRDDPKESRPLDCIEAFREGQPLINCNVVLFLVAYLVVYGEKDMTMGIKIVDGPSIICIFSLYSGDDFFLILSFFLLNF